MDELFRKDNFQPYKRRLEDAKKAVADEMYMKSVDEKTKVIETKLSDLSEAKNYVSLLGILMGMLAFSLLMVFVNHGFNLQWLIVLIMIIGYLLFYRFSMKTAETKTKLLESYANDDINAEFYAKANYLSSQITLRKTRINLTRFFYVLFFPLFLLLLDLSLSSEGLTSPIKAALLAFSLGSIFWYFYFSGGLKELDMTKQDLEEIKSNFAEQQIQ